MFCLQAHAFPLLHAGGLFLLIVGAAIALGALVFRRRYLVLAIAACAGAVVLIMFSRALSAPYGAPTTLQTSALAAAVFVEGLLFAVLMPRVGARGERARTLAVLAIVAFHFAIMTPAFGPAIFLLAVANGANVALAWRARPYPLPWVWAVDGVMKAAAGGFMLAGDRLLGFSCG